MSKSKSTRTVERTNSARPPAEEVRSPAPHLVPHPPVRRRGYLIAALVLLAAWILFLVGLAIFGS